MVRFLMIWVMCDFFSRCSIYMLHQNTKNEYYLNSWDKVITVAYYAEGAWRDNVITVAYYNIYFFSGRVWILLMSLQCWCSKSTPNECAVTSGGWGCRQKKNILRKLLLRFSFILANLFMFLFLCRLQSYYFIRIFCVMLVCY